MTSSVSKFEKISEKNFFQAIFGSQVPQRIPVPTIGTTKHNQADSTKTYAYKADMPFFILVVTTKTTQNADKKDSIIWAK
jgi:hypothetical protein